MAHNVCYTFIRMSETSVLSVSPFFLCTPSKCLQPTTLVSGDGHGWDLREVAVSVSWWWEGKYSLWVSLSPTISWCQHEEMPSRPNTEARSSNRTSEDGVLLIHGNDHNDNSWIIYRAHMTHCSESLAYVLFGHSHNNPLVFPIFCTKTRRLRGIK